MRFLVILLLGTTLNVFSQEVKTLKPSKDNTIFSESENSAGLGQLYAGKTCQSDVRRALIQFDVSSIPPTAEIIEVTLKIDINKVNPRASTTDDSYNLHTLTKKWGEGTSAGSGQGETATAFDATWNNAEFGSSVWTTPGGDFEPTPSATFELDNTVGTKIIASPDIVKDVEGWVNGTKTNNGWILIGDESNNCTARRFGSKDLGTAPQLVIQYAFPLNITESSLLNSVKVYPNPLHDNNRINIDNAQHASVEIYDINGQLILESPYIHSANHEFAFDAPEGLYVVKITLGNQSSYQKLIKR